MAKTIILFTIFTLSFFTITTALIAADPITVTDDVTDDVKTQTFSVKSTDQIPEFAFARPHPIKREFYATRIPLRLVKRRPCRKFLKKVMIPRSYGNDMIVDTNTFRFDTETIGNNEKYEHMVKNTKRGHKGGFVRRIRKFLKRSFE